MLALVFDCETDGLVPTRVHCLTIRNVETREKKRYVGCEVPEGCARLAEADLVIGHNIIGYDIPALTRLAGLKLTKKTKVFDTLVAARVIWPRDVLVDRDFRRWPDCAKLKELRARFKEIPSEDLRLRIEKAEELVKFIGAHSLAAFGYRLGNYKGDFKGPWDEYTEEMGDYCDQDTDVTLDLYLKILEQEWPEASLDLEHEVAAIIEEQTRRGFLFDVVKAAELYATLSGRREKLRRQLVELFPPWEAKARDFIPKVNNAKLGYVKGERVVVYKTVEFNPSSRQHIALCLQRKYGWVPDERTETGEPKIDETVLASLPYEEAKLLADYFTVEKRIGQLAEGAQAWMKKVADDGRIHGRVNPNGAVTGRMTHMDPNLAQVPASSSPYGHECRELFCVPPGFMLVGADADALELRCLAGFMAKWDKGAYIKTVLEGKKEDGTDIHSVNCRALGLDPKEKYPIDGKPTTGRDIAKVWFYAFIYGAGDYKLGKIMGVTGTRGAITAAGQASRERFLRQLPALGKLTKTVQAVLADRGYLLGLDGRRLYARGKHSALNTLLQSAGALIMKVALVIFAKKAREAGLLYSAVWPVGNIHDEIQSEVKGDEAAAENIGRMKVASLEGAGKFFDFPCPITGQFKVGKTWADTH